MHSSNPSLLAIPSELRLRIYEDVFKLERDDDGVAHYSIRINTDDHQTVRNGLALRRVCRLVKADVDYLISGTSKATVELVDITCDGLDLWLRSIGEEPGRRIMDFDWKRSDDCHLATNIADLMFKGVMRTVHPDEHSQCSHSCHKEKEIEWQAKDMRGLHDTGICRLHIDLQRLHQDIAAGAVTTSVLAFPPQAVEPYLIGQGYVQGFYCGSKNGHVLSCASYQWKVLRRRVFGLCDMQGNVAITNETLLGLCGLSGSGRFDLKLTFVKGEAA